MTLTVVGSGSSGNCYILQNNNEALIVECGCKMADVKKALNFNVSKVAGAICTHKHADHSKYANDFRSMGIQTFAAEEINELTEYIERGGKLEYYGIRYENFIVVPFPNRTPGGKWLHNNSDGSECPCYGFWIYHKEIGRLVYASDTECIVQRFKGINHFLIEANYSQDLVDRDSAKFKHQIQGHMSIDTACDFLKANRSSSLRNVILCHLSKTSSNANIFLDKASKVVDCDCYVATGNLTINL